VKQFYVADETGKSMQEKKIMFLLTPKARRFIFGNDRYCANPKEAYLSFKELNPEKFLGFSYPAELQPRHCLLSAASGTHVVCVCTIHQNVKSAISNAKLYDLIQKQIKNDYLSKILFNVPQCMLLPRRL
jgi:hypothetical protein